jgi:hypothetical protein
MTDEQPPSEAEEDPFKDSDEWIAAEARQLFRALSAYDVKAIEICLLYLCDFLAKTLRRHLRGLLRWDIKGLWFDGLDAPDFAAESASTLRITAWLRCVATRDDDEDWWREPFEFELRLIPRTGEFQGYRFRVGDHRPRTDKMMVGLEIGMSKRIELEPFRIVDLLYEEPKPVGDWLEEIVRGQFPVEGQDA